MGLYQALELHTTSNTPSDLSLQKLKTFYFRERVWPISECFPCDICDIFFSVVDLISSSRQSPHRKKDKSRQTLSYSEVVYLLALGKHFTVSPFWKECNLWEIYW